MIALDPTGLSWDTWMSRQCENIGGDDLPTDVTEANWRDFASEWMDRNDKLTQGHIPPPLMFNDWREWAITLFRIDQAERFAAP